MYAASGTGRTALPGEPAFFCGSTGADVARRFHLLGCAALDAKNDIGLLVMDELGLHEENVSEFYQAVRSALEGDVPILGVLQEADSP